MKPDEEVKKRVRRIFAMRTIEEMSRRTGYPASTLKNWKRNPISIKAIDLIRLENKTGLTGIAVR
jgi:DNA invertase Pin-like site-specific DNA recombinase